ncbi:helix-turn-helix domain-containing protein [Niastella populi]|uniref:HTH araC/xylS-type domain-containing protein n=1 Tax=Niastella populi TaxID=550983 RepID=A0A1V9GAU7_9BACT|nr:AraC family transcriptional regulator [Niastella populi]OQP67795.1 hypothetical protein A4R26_32830 [Niastella populi]
MHTENHFSLRVLVAAAKVKDSIDLKFSLVTGTAPPTGNVHTSADIEWKSVEEFAQELKVNRKDLQRAFKYCNDKGINEYLACRKMEAACMLLAYGEKTIKEIAIDLDYTQNHFSFFFKKRKGLTPLEWQKKNGNGNNDLKS